MRVRTHCGLVVAGCALVLCLSCGRGGREIVPGTPITILYTTDVRGRLDGCGCARDEGGLARRSAALHAARDQDPAALYCDAGNFASGSGPTDSTRGQVIVEAYNRLHPVAVNVSERELAFGVDAFKALRKSAKFEFISANLRHQGGALARPYVTHSVKDARVAFIGLCGTKDVMRSDSAMLPAGVTVEDPLVAARRAVAGLEGKADVIVVLSTCGDAADSALVQALPQINAIIGGRSFRINPDSPWVIGESRIVRADHDGRSLGRLTLVFGTEHKVRDYLAARVTLDQRVPPDDEMIALIRKHVPGFAVPAASRK